MVRLAGSLTAAVVLSALAALPAWTDGPVPQATEPPPAVDVPGVPRSEIPQIDLHARLAVQFLSTTKEIAHCDWPYIQFFSFYRTPEKLLPIHTKLLNVWVHQLSFEQQISPLKEVPGSRGRLWWGDLRNYGWCRAAMQAVAEREPYSQEPWINHEHAEFLRRAAGTRNSAAALKKGIFHAQQIVRGDWFLRETMESDLSPSYYDLLFSRFRFPHGQRLKHITREETIPEDYTESEYWPGGVDPKNGKYYEPGTYKVKKTRLKTVTRTLDVEDDTFVDFPKNVAEWDRAFGVDKINQFARAQQIDLDFGGIVEGGADNPKEGSIVAGHNRLIVTKEGPLGAAMRTFDVFETTGDRDYSEKLIFKNGHFVKGDGADAVFDAGELIYYLPNGGFAGFLINGQGDRAEIAATKAANATHDKRNNPGVRNVGDCFMCHAPHDGYIMPPNFLKDFLDVGGDLRFQDPERLNRVKGFFFRWQGRVKGYRARFKDLVDETTADPPEPGKDRQPGWTGAKFAEELQEFRNWWDAPLSKEDVLAEIGIPEKEYRILARMSGDYRPQAVLKGKLIPRRTWQIDIYPKLQLLRQSLVDKRAREAGP